MSSRRSLFLSCVLIALSVHCRAQAWSGILDPSRAVNWKRANVGVVGGIPTNYTQCGPTIAAYSGTAAKINTAIAACGANQYVLLGAGTFNLSTSITSSGQSSYVLRGAGPNATKLVFTGAGVGGIYSAPIFICSTNCWAADNPNVQPGKSNAANWTGGFAQGSTSITLSNVGSAGILNGDVVILDQQNDTAPNNGYMQCDFIPGGFPCSAAGTNLNNTGRYINNVSYAQMQYVKVVSGCSSACVGTGPFSITIAQPLYANNWHAAGQPTGAYFIKGINHVGIENLTIDATQCPNDATCQSGVTFMNCEQCWARNLSVINTRRNHIWLVNGSRDEVRDSYFYGVKNSASQSYGIELFPADDSLIENNIFQQISSPFMSGGGAGNVWAYNFSRNNPVAQGYTYMQASYLSHSDGDYMNLFEGNDVNGLFSDQLHGTSGLITVFRNWITGRDYNVFVSGDGLTTNQTFPFDLDSYNRGYNIVGNVLGTPGYHNLYEAYAPNSYTRDQCNHSIYELGFGGGVCGADSAAGVANDPVVRSTLMRWGNYDVVSGTVRWDTAESSPGAVAYISAQVSPLSRALPASFYLSSKPSWWGSMPYPAAGPDVTGGTGPGGFAYINPAQACYLNVLGGPVSGAGGVLSFDADRCYPSAGASSNGVAPPISVKAIAQ